MTEAGYPREQLAEWGLVQAPLALQPVVIAYNLPAGILPNGTTLVIPHNEFASD